MAQAEQLLYILQHSEPLTILVSIRYIPFHTQSGGITETKKEKLGERKKCHIYIGEMVFLVNQ